MIPLPAFLRTPSQGRVDVDLILALVANALLLGTPALAWATGHPIDLTSPAALAYGAVVLTQTVLLTSVARRSGRRAEERSDIELLVQSMDSDGPIRLDLDVVQSESALGVRLKRVQQRMAEVLGQVHQSAHGVRQAAQELNASGEQLSHRTERSAASLRDAAMTLKDINVIVQTRAQAALEGRALFEQMTQRMHDIDKALRRITDILGVIDGIAFETDILARNAAVEATRAGEQGRGFAAVAAEVRKLALRSRAAAAEVKSLIGASIETVHNGNETLASAGERMTEMLASVRQVGEAFQRVSADTNEHAGSLGVITQTVKDFDEMTRQSVAMVEASRRVAHTLAQQGAHLEQVLASFKLGELSVAPATAAAPCPPTSTRAKAAADLSASHKLAAAVIQAAAQPRTPAATAPPAAPPEGGSNVNFF